MLTRCESLVRILRNLEPFSIVEVGVNLGKNAHAMLREFDVVEYHLVDPYEDYGDSSAPFGSTSEAKQNLEKAKTKLEDWKNICTWHITNSTNVEVTTDVAYIDGDHRQNAVSRDLDHWWPRTSKLLVGDDYYENTDKFNNFMKTQQIIEGPGKAGREFAVRHDLDLQFELPQSGRYSTAKFYFIKEAADG